VRPSPKGRARRFCGLRPARRTPAPRAEAVHGLRPARPAPAPPGPSQRTAVACPRRVPAIAGTLLRAAYSPRNLSAGSMASTAASCSSVGAAHAQRRPFSIARVPAGAPGPQRCRGADRQQKVANKGGGAHDGQPGAQQPARAPPAHGRIRRPHVALVVQRLDAGHHQRGRERRVVVARPVLLRGHGRAQVRLGPRAARRRRAAWRPRRGCALAGLRAGALARRRLRGRRAAGRRVGLARGEAVERLGRRRRCGRGRCGRGRRRGGRLGGGAGCRLVRQALRVLRACARGRCGVETARVETCDRCVMYASVLAVPEQSLC